MSNIKKYIYSILNSITGRQISSINPQVMDSVNTSRQSRKFCSWDENYVGTRDWEIVRISLVAKYTRINC